MGGLDAAFGRLGRRAFASVGASLLALCVQSCGKSDAGAAPTGGASGAAGSGAAGSGAAGGNVASGGVEAGAGEAGTTGDAGASVGGSGPDASGGGVNTGGTGGMRETCTGTVSRAQPVPSVFEFLVDTSGSMLEQPQGAPASKYALTRDSLVQTFEEMQEGSGVGLIFFPNTKAGPASGACIVREEAVPIGRLDGALRDSLSAALAAKTPSGATPTHDALRYAIETLRASPVAGDKYLVLVTDGAPTYALDCMGDGMTPADSAPLLAETDAALRTNGIHTFVIGSPGSEAARSTLSQLATLGGTAPPGCSDAGPTYCHFDMTTAVDLSKALSDGLRAITDSAETCRYVIPLPPGSKLVELDKLDVLVQSSAGTSQLVRSPTTAADCVGGWRYAASNTEVELCPDACEQVKADPSAFVEVLLGCSAPFP